MIQIWNDTLKVNGKYSQKRVMVYSSFFSSFFYAHIPLFCQTFEVREFVFLGFLGTGGFSIFRLQKTNQNTQTNGETTN